MSSVRANGRRRSAILPTLVVVAVLVVAFALFTNVWTTRLWYRSFNFGSVFSTMLLTRAGLFLVFGLVMAGLVSANAAIAYRLRPRFRPQGPTSPLLERYREIVETRFIWVMIAIGVVVGLFAGAAASGQALTFLAWTERTGFGVQDPQYGLDVSFFVFSYPWWRFVLSFAFAALTVSVIAAAVMHYVMGAVRFSGPRRGGTTPAQAHLSVLVGLTLLVRGASYWFDQYGLEITNNTPLFTGISYTADHATANAKLILAIAAGIVALLFLANAVLQRWVIPTAGLVLLVLSSIVLGYVYPGAVQYFSVRPSEEIRERAYIEQNIAATRAAYGVADAQVTDYSATTQASAGQLRSDAEALPGIRLIDPSVVSPTYEQLQQVRGYYQFPKILDVDRYTINGAETDAVVAVREMNLDGIDQQSRNWNNLKTVYTHGLGLVSAYGNRAQANGEPQWITQAIPPVGEIAEHEPRIYFGELQGQRPDEYSIVGAPAGAAPVELDTPGGPNYTYAGTGGVSIGSLWHKLLYAAKFADINILLSNRVNDASRIIYDRTPRERVQQAAPWLKVDGDAYPAVVEGRIVWIVDGYTTSNSYPNSNRINLATTTADSQTSAGGPVVAQPGDEINYMRNSVKAVVDAYDGTVKLYAWDEADPILKTYQKVFGSTIMPRSAIPADLLAHLRYPQDYFKVQRQILARYHQTDPSTWYRQSSLWAIPEDPVNAASNSVEQPFYLSVKWPGDENAIFSLTTSYVANGRSNLAAYMAVNADASSPDYGKIRILQMSDSTQIDGPGQSFNAITTNETVSAALRNFTAQGSSQASFGNLLTLPLGGGLLYAMPVYAQRPGATGSYPVLRFVAVRFGQSVGFGSSLQEALDQVFQGSSGVDTDPGDTGNGDGGTGTGTGQTGSPAAQAALTEAANDYADAQKALTAGNLAEYQSKINDAQQAVARAQQALGG